MSRLHVTTGKVWHYLMLFVSPYNGTNKTNYLHRGFDRAKILPDGTFQHSIMIKNNNKAAKEKADAHLVVAKCVSCNLQHEKKDSIQCCECKSHYCSLTCADDVEKTVIEKNKWTCFNCLIALDTAAPIAEAGAANATTPPTDADADAVTEAADDADIVDDAPTADNSAFEAPTVENSFVI